LLYLKTKTKQLNINHLNKQHLTHSLLPGRRAGNNAYLCLWRDLDQLRAGFFGVEV